MVTNILPTINNETIGLNHLPKVDTFLGMIDLKTGSMIIAAVCVVHPLVYGCTFFMPLSYLLLTIWILLAMFFAISVVLFFGLINNDNFLIALWIWYTLVFIVIMLMLMFLLALVFTAKNQRVKVLAVILGILWYIFTVYFILVVNSHRKALLDATETTTSGNNLEIGSPDPPNVADPPKAPDTPKVTDTPKDTDPADVSDPDLGFRTGKDRLVALRKASAKGYTKQ